MSLLQKFQAGTLHISIITQLQCVTSPWTVPSASMNHTGTWASQNSHLQNPLWDIRHTSPTCILQPVQEDKCLYLCGICITSYCSWQEVFSGIQQKDIWASRGSTAMAEECWMLLPTHAKPNQALRCQTTEEGSRVAACPIPLQIRPRIRWNCLAPLQPSSAQSPASAWSWNSAQTTSCVSLSVAKITCKQTKNHLKLSCPANQICQLGYISRARWCRWDQTNTNTDTPCILALSTECHCTDPCKLEKCHQKQKQGFKKYLSFIEKYQGLLQFPECEGEAPHLTLG